LEDYSLAYTVNEENLAVRRALEDRVGIAQTLCNLGYVVHYQGDIDRAGALFTESLILRRELADTMGTVISLEGLAGVIMSRGELERAAQLYGAAAAIRDSIGGKIELADLMVHDRNMAMLRSLLDEASYQAAWAEGQWMSQDEAIASALSVNFSAQTANS
jgi:hypothetical protein